LGPIYRISLDYFKFFIKLTCDRDLQRAKTSLGNIVRGPVSHQTKSVCRDTASEFHLRKALRPSCDVCKLVVCRKSIVTLALS